MLAYLILAGRNRAPVDEELIRRFDQEDPPETPFHPAERIIWRSQDGSVVFFGWQAYTDVAGMGSHWVVGERGLTAFAGHCWPRETGWDHGSGRSWADQLRTFLYDQPDLVAAREALYGHFSLIALANNAPGAVVSDFANMHQLFFAEGADVTAVSNRAVLCARAVAPPGISPKRSLTGAGWLIGEGWMLDTESGYWEVERPPFGSYVSIDFPQGARVLELPGSPLVDQGGTSTPVDYDAALDEVEGDLRSTIRAIAELPVPDREIWLSGGKDSRMLIGIVLSEGAADRFRFVTQGAPERSDVRSAQMIAARFRLDWRREEHSGRSPEQELENVSFHTGLVEAMTSAWSASATVAFTPGVSLTGIGGENLRSDVVDTYCGKAARTQTALVANMQRRHVFDRLEVLRPEARAYYQHILADWVRDQALHGLSLESIAAIYTYGLLGYTRNAPVCTWSARLNLSPFITPACARMHHRLGKNGRLDPRFPLDLVRRCSVELSKIPLAATRWLDQEIAHLPDAEEYRRIPPVLTTSPAATTWRVQRYADYRPMLETFLLDRENPIHELLDHDRLVERITTGDAHPGRTRLLWGVLTAAVWMGHHERQVKLTP